MTQTHGVIDFYGTIWKHEKCVKVKKKPSIKNGVQNMEKNLGKSKSCEIQNPGYSSA